MKIQKVYICQIHFHKQELIGATLMLKQMKINYKITNGSEAITTTGNLHLSKS